MRLFGTVCRRIEKTLAVLMAILIAVMYIVLTVQVFARYLFSYGIIWTDEFSRYAHVWAVVITGAVVVMDDSHIRMNVLEEAIPVLVKPFAVLRQAVAMIFGVAIMYFSRSLFELGLSAVSTNMQISMAIVYACFPIGGFFIVMFALFRMISILLGRTDELEEGAGAYE